MNKKIPLSSINLMKYKKYVKPNNYKLIIIGDSFSSTYFNSIYSRFIKLYSQDTLLITDNPIIENKLFWSQYVINNCESIDFRNPYLKFFSENNFNFEQIYNINFQNNEIKLINGQTYYYDYLFISQDPIPKINNDLYEELVNEFSNIYSNYNLETSNILKKRLLENYNENKIIILNTEGEFDNFENSINLSNLLKQKYPKSELKLLIKGNKLSKKEYLNEFLINNLKQNNIIIEFTNENYELNYKEDFIIFNNNKNEFDLLIIDPLRVSPNYLKETGIYEKDKINKKTFQHNEFKNIFVTNDNFEYNYSNMNNKINNTKLITNNLKEYINKEWELTENVNYKENIEKDEYFIFNKKNRITKINEKQITYQNNLWNYYYYINIVMLKYQYLMSSKKWISKKEKNILKNKYFYFN